MKKISMVIGVSYLLLGLTACGGDNAGIEKGEVKEISDNFKNQTPAKSISDDFQSQVSAWKSYEGKWIFENGGVKQSSLDDHFPVILREDQQFSDLDISINFKPISGDIDASGGIIFRAKNAGNYYIVRANALEDNFRLYTFINGRRSQIASASVTLPALNKVHQMRVVAKGDHIQAYLNGELKLDYHDKTYTNGYIGLWTKADSVTIFDDLSVRSLD